MRRAFTLIEIVVVIALIAIVSGAVALRMDNLVPGLRRVSAEQAVERACTLASHLAWTEKKRFFVATTNDNSAIVVENSHGESIETFPLPSDTKQKVRFRVDPRDSTTFFVPAQLEEIAEIEFHPSGCATPAVIEILTNGKTTKIMQMDPFSGGLTERSLLR